MECPEQRSGHLATHTAGRTSQNKIDLVEPDSSAFVVDALQDRASKKTLEATHAAFSPVSRNVGRIDEHDRGNGRRQIRLPERRRDDQGGTQEEASGARARYLA